MGGEETTEALRCGPCGAPVPAARAGPARIVTCPECGAVLDLLPRATSAPRVPLPMGVHVQEQGKRLVVRLRRSSLQAVWVPALGLATAAIAGVILAANGLPTEAMVGAAAMGLAGVYALVQGVVNRLRLVAEDGRLELASGPLPWPGGGVLLDRPRSLSVRRYVYKVRDEDAEGAPASYAFAWELLARTPAGAQVTLLVGCPDPFVPLWVQQRVGEHLGLGTEPEGGEVASEASAP